MSLFHSTAAAKMCFVIGERQYVLEPGDTVDLPDRYDYVPQHRKMPLASGPGAEGARPVQGTPHKPAPQLRPPWISEKPPRFQTEEDRYYEATRDSDGFDQSDSTIQEVASGVAQVAEGLAAQGVAIPGRGRRRG